MNPYFARLAQRSSVSAAIPNKQPRGASAGAESAAWGENNLEITALGNSQAQVSQAVVTDSSMATDLSSLGNHHVTNASEIPTNNTGATIVGPEPHSVAINQAVSFPSTIALPKTLSSDSHVLVSNDGSPSTIEKPEIHTSKWASDLPTVSQTSTISTADNSHHKSSAKTSREYSSQIKSFSLVDAETNAAFESINNNKSTPPPESMESLDQQHVQKSQQIRARAVAPTSLIERSDQSERVASNPVQVAGLSMQPIRTALHSSVQVNIGKIELEVYAPAKKPVPAPPPPQSAISKPSAGSRSAAFNPHRHYLRSR